MVWQELAKKVLGAWISVAEQTAHVQLNLPVLRENHRLILLAWGRQVTRQHLYWPWPWDLGLGGGRGRCLVYSLHPTG